MKKPRPRNAAPGDAGGDLEDRAPSPAEDELWRQVTSDVEPLKPQDTFQEGSRGKSRDGPKGGLSGADAHRTETAAEPGKAKPGKRAPPPPPPPPPPPAEPELRHGEAPGLDRRGTLRIQMDTAEKMDPSFESVHEYESALSLAYPAARPSAIKHMAQHGLKVREDGRFALKMDPALRGATAGRLDPEAMKKRSERLTALLWSCLEKLRCPTLVVRGAASDVMSPEVADRMVDEVIPDARLAVIPQAGHSVMIDNPDAFRDAVSAFVLGDA